MRKIDEIIVHCSATRPAWMEAFSTASKVNEIRRWHREDRGWSDIGYHYLIDRDGTVAEGRPVARAGAHVLGHNATTIGVCLIGGHGAAARDVFDEHFTYSQSRALFALLRRLRDAHGRVPVSGHNDYAAKGCPGFNVHEWLIAAHERERQAFNAASQRAAEAAPAAGLAPSLLGALRRLIARLQGGSP